MAQFNQLLMETVNRILDKTNNVPMLLGEPGIGKSSWVKDLAKQRHTKAFTLACNQLADKADLTGARTVPDGVRIVKDANGNDVEKQDYTQIFCPHVTIKMAIDYALQHPDETPILFMDELNRTTPDVTSEALSLPTERKLGENSLPNNLKIIAAGNDKGNITALDEASRSRFVLIHVMPDLQTFLAVNPNLNPFIERVLTAHPDTLFGRRLPATMVQGKDDDDDDNDMTSIEDIYSDDGEEMNQLTTPRTITALSEWLNDMDNAKIQQYMGTLVTTVDGENMSYLQEIIEGFTGKTQFTMLLMAEIAANINSINSQSKALTVPKPKVYDTLVACTTRDALQDCIANMQERDRSGCLVYAMFDKTANSDIIELLTNSVTKLEKDDSSNLFMIFKEDAVSQANKNAFFGTHSQLSNFWENMFS